MVKEIYQIQIALKNFKPKIWRRLLVQSDLLLPDFHKIIQTTMGWTNSHLHHFIKDRIFYTVKMKGDSFWGDLDNIDYKKIKLSDILTTEKEKIIYEYDFGDGWEHDIILEKILPDDKTQSYPICIAGKMNCPPEDCGGVWGYSDLLEILKHPDHDEYEEYLEWLGDEFEPDYFDKDAINEMLKFKDFGCVQFY